MEKNPGVMSFRSVRGRWRSGSRDARTSAFGARPTPPYLVAELHPRGRLVVNLLAEKIGDRGRVFVQIDSLRPAAAVQLAASRRSWPFLEIGARSAVIKVQVSPPSSLQKISPPVVPPKIAQAPFASSRQSAPNSCFKLGGNPPPSRSQFLPPSRLR